MKLISISVLTLFSLSAYTAESCGKITSLGVSTEYNSGGSYEEAHVVMKDLDGNSFKSIVHGPSPVNLLIAAKISNKDVCFERTGGARVRLKD